MIKHLSAFVSQRVGKSVSIVSITINPEGPFFDVDNDGKYIPGSDFEECTITYSAWGENFGKDIEEGEFIWRCEEQELIENW